MPKVSVVGVFYDNNHEFRQETRDEQIIAERCKRLIENAIICWNYLYLSEKLNNAAKAECKGLITLQRHFSALTKFAHVESRFCGRKRRGKAALEVPINPCAGSVRSRSVAVGLSTC